MDIAPSVTLSHIAHPSRMDCVAGATYTHTFSLWSTLIVIAFFHRCPPRQVRGWHSGAKGPLVTVGIPCELHLDYPKGRSLVHDRLGGRLHLMGTVLACSE